MSFCEFDTDGWCLSHKYLWRVGCHRLHFAAHDLDLKTIKELLDAGVAVDLESKNEYRLTALRLGAQRGDEQIVKELLQRKANLNKVGDAEDQRTPLMAAAWHHHDSVVKLLLEHRADTSLKDKDGKTALELAIAQSQWQAVGLLLPVPEAPPAPFPKR